ncbi:hypothetical protein [Natronolimnobius baerhuensis]|uniref:DUF3267 domain-containing protein n=1 Tax=Natronolimnobius baerhuensis TaxID=253108 RepID=A0A202E7F3_9EURY|nr:hypothetical protein [Natronolimnobius baerhuensis]OVE84192.1 hypothetical protein B2G88_07155 [Natronolimnobius baerhuensis]
MIGIDVVGAGVALALAVGIGLCAHEWSHALVLRSAGIDFTLEYLPDRSSGPLGLLASCPWAVVEPQPTGRDSAWVLRIAALMPLLLAAPVLALGAAGYLTAATPAVTAAAIGWLACSIPSPQDFSVAFHAEQLLEEATDTSAVVTCSRAD